MSSNFTNDSNKVVQNFDCHQDFNNKFDKAFNDKARNNFKHNFDNKFGKTFNDKALKNSVKKDS